METKIWVNITFNAHDQLVGKDDFLAALQGEGIVVQERKKWQPADVNSFNIKLLNIKSLSTNSLTH